MMIIKKKNIKRTIISLFKVIILLIVSGSVNAQGIHFEKELTWQQVLAKAKTENKYIFVDCYATWCGPCKWMDANIYPNKATGDVYNKDFISIRVQMDKTKSDNDTIKSWYTTSAMLTKNYNVNSFPTFLFFDPNGKAMNKATGAMRVKDFVQLAEDYQNPDKQYLALFDEYKAEYEKGGMEYQRMPKLVELAVKLGESELAMKVAADYMHGYLDKLPEKDFLKKDNQQFIGENAMMVTTNDRIFKLCYNQPVLVDTATHDKGGAYRFSSFIINKEEIKPSIAKAKQDGTEPNWQQISDHISRKYGEKYVTDNENLVNAKIWWYYDHKDGPKYTKYLTIKAENHFEKVGFHAGAENYYNANAFDVFKYDSEVADLQKALTWIRKVNQSQQASPDAGDLDTEANLLYKLGKKEEALNLETRATQLNPRDQEIAGNLKKMTAGQQTWPDQME